MVCCRARAVERIISGHTAFEIARQIGRSPTEVRAFLAILRQLEHLGVPVINPSSAIEAVKDKLYAHQILAQRACQSRARCWCASR